MRKLQHSATDHAAVMGMQNALVIAAGSFTEAFQAGAALDMLDREVTQAVSCFDSLILEALLTLGNADKVALRLQVSVDNTNWAWLLEGDEIWERVLDRRHSGITVALPQVQLDHMYVKVLAAGRGSDLSTTAITVKYHLALNNTTPVRVVTARGELAQVTAIPRALADLAASGGVQEHVLDVEGQQWAALYGFYLPTAAATTPKLGVLARQSLFDDAAGFQYYTPNTVLERPHILAGGARIQTEMRPEEILLESRNLKKSVTTGSWAGGVATLEVGASHGFVVGDLANISGVTPAGYNRDFAYVTGLTATEIKYALASDPGAWSSGGNVTLFDEFRLEFREAWRANRIKVGLWEHGDASNPGKVFMIARTTRA